MMGFRSGVNAFETLMGVSLPAVGPGHSGLRVAPALRAKPCMSLTRRVMSLLNWVRLPKFVADIISVNVAFFHSRVINYLRRPRPQG